MKRALVFIGVSILIGCTSQSDADKNVAVATAMFDAFNQHDWTRMAEFYSIDATFLDPAFGKDYVTQSREEIAHKYAELEKMFPDVHDHVIGMYPSADKVTVEFISTGSLSDSVKFKLPIIAVLTFKDGLIIKDATYYDQENP